MVCFLKLLFYIDPKNQKVISLLSPFHSRTALHLACSKAHKEIIIHLCSLHANVNLQDGDGATPMHKVRGWGL